MARKHKSALTLTDFSAVEARGGRVYWGRAHVRRDRDHYVMEGPSGVHTLLRAATDLERLNAHWVTFASKNEYA